MDTSIYSKLLPGEEILWNGQPKKSKGLNFSNIGTTIFGIFWLGFSLFWTTAAFIGTRSINSSDPTGSMFKYSFPLFGLPFITVGILLVFVAPMNQRKKNKRTFYYVTNKRVIINIDTEKSPLLNSVFIGDLKGVQVYKNRDKTGNIFFASLFANNSNTYKTNKSTSYKIFNPSNCFNRIENSDDVYQLILLRQELACLNQNNNSNMNN